MNISHTKLTAKKDKTHISSDVTIDPKISVIKKTPTDVKALMHSNIRLIVFGAGAIAGLALGIILSPYFFSVLAVGIAALAIELAYRWHLSNKSTIAKAEVEEKPKTLEWVSNLPDPSNPQNTLYNDGLNGNHVPDDLFGNLYTSNPA